jgi:hypothetical protein
VTLLLQYTIRTVLLVMFKIRVFEPAQSVNIMTVQSVPGERIEEHLFWGKSDRWP